MWGAIIIPDWTSLLMEKPPLKASSTCQFARILYPLKCSTSLRGVMIETHQEPVSQWFCTSCSSHLAWIPGIAEIPPLIVTPNARCASRKKAVIRCPEDPGFANTRWAGIVGWTIFLQGNTCFSSLLFFVRLRPVCLPVYMCKGECECKLNVHRSGIPIW